MFSEICKRCPRDDPTEPHPRHVPPLDKRTLRLVCTMTFIFLEFILKLLAKHNGRSHQSISVFKMGNCASLLTFHPQHHLNKSYNLIVILLLCLLETAYFLKTFIPISSIHFDDSDSLFIQSLNSYLFSRPVGSILLQAGPIPRSLSLHSNGWTGLWRRWWNVQECQNPTSGVINRHYRDGCQLYLRDGSKQ